MPVFTILHSEVGGLIDDDLLRDIFNAFKDAGCKSLTCDKTGVNGYEFATEIKLPEKVANLIENNGLKVQSDEIEP